MPSFTPGGANLSFTTTVPEGNWPLWIVPQQGGLILDSDPFGIIEALPTVFSDVILPESIALGAAGGPTWNTLVHRMFSGYEERNPNWVRPIQRWNIGYNIQTLEDLQPVVDIFYVCQGRTYGFLMKDPSDYLSNGPPTKTLIPVANSDQNIGTGDGVETLFQITKTYTVGSRSLVRNITRPINGTLLVAVNAVAQTENTHYVVNYNTGKIQFLIAPGNGLAITCGFEFRVATRFDTDALDKQVDTFWLGEVPNLPVVELLE